MSFLADEHKHAVAHGAGQSGKFEILTKIREAEAKAEKTVADAHVAKQKTIDDAQKKANELRVASAEKITKESDAELKAFYGTLAKKKEKILLDCNADAEARKKSGEKKLPKAVDFLFESFKAKTNEQ